MSESPTSPVAETAAAPAAEKRTMDIAEIMSLIPHRYPFLLIDRVIEVERKVRIVALKNVTINEPHFMGHFPDYPIMPGVLTIEAMAQAGGTVLMLDIPDAADKLMVFTGIENARFRRPVVPGDQLRIEVAVVNWRSRVVKMQGSVTVDGKLVADATITCGLVPRVREPRAASEPVANEVAGE